MNAKSEAAWRRFRAQVETQGGQVVEPAWLGSNAPHRIVCRSGHEATPRPSSVNNGTGICRPCSGTDPATTERAFRALIVERGGTVLEPKWLGAHTPHRVICAQGHETTPRPTSILNRGSGCIVCAGKDQGTAWRLFRRLIEERGGQVLEPQPLGVSKPHRVRCPEGHETKAIPSSVRIGLAFCHLCRPTSTARAEQQFGKIVAAQGGRILEPKWLGTKVPHRVVCGLGHETSPRPNDVQQTGSICRVCAGHDADASWSEFQNLVARLGGRVVEPGWLGNKKPHRVVCTKGHSSVIRPNNVQQGGGICRTCAYKVWDVFYVVANDTAQAVKFGITSYDPRARLRYHAIDGFDRVIKTITSMPEAPDLERKILTSLRTAGVAAIAGREYFDMGALPLIMHVIASWLPTDAATSQTVRSASAETGQANQPAKLDRDTAAEKQQRQAG